MHRISLLVPLILTGIAATNDVRRREIPDGLPLAIAVWGLAAAVLGWGPPGWPSVIAGSALAAALGGLMFFVCGFGGGDAKLIASLGVALGVVGVVWTALYMAVAGGALGLVAAARGRRTLAYGPAIGIGLLAYVVQVWTR